MSNDDWRVNVVKFCAYLDPYRNKNIRIKLLTVLKSQDLDRS